MSGITQHIELVTNEDFELADRWTDSAGVPYALSHARMQIRGHRSDAGSPLLDVSDANGFITLAGPDWWATVLIPKATLAALDFFGVGVWDLEVTRAVDGRVKQLAQGFARIRQGVTR